MTQNSGSRILRVQKLIQEQMDADAKRPQGKVPHILGKVERGKRDGERQVGESGLWLAALHDRPQRQTHIHRYTWDEHDHRQSVEKLASRVD